MPNHGLHGHGEGGHGAAGEGAAHHGPHFGIELVDLLALVGIAGLFLAAFSFILKKNAVICINEPRLFESMRHENY
jgi:hypothetical protein